MEWDKGHRARENLARNNNRIIHGDYIGDQGGPIKSSPGEKNFNIADKQLNGISNNISHKYFRDIGNTKAAEAPLSSSEVRASFHNSWCAETSDAPDDVTQRISAASGNSGRSQVNEMRGVTESPVYNKSNAPRILQNHVRNAPPDANKLYSANHLAVDPRLHGTDIHSAKLSSGNPDARQLMGRKPLNNNIGEREFSLPTNKAIESGYSTPKTPLQRLYNRWREPSQDMGRQAETLPDSTKLSGDASRRHDSKFHSVMSKIKNPDINQSAVLETINPGKTDITQTSRRGLAETQRPKPSRNPQNFRRGSPSNIENQGVPRRADTKPGAYSDKKYSATHESNKPGAKLPSAKKITSTENGGHESGAQPHQPVGVKLRFTKQEQTAGTAKTGEKTVGKPADKPIGKPIENAKTAKARKKAEKAHGKLEKAKKKLPRKRKISLRSEDDPKTGKPKRRLKFEEEVKSQKAHLKGPVATRPIKLGANSVIAYGHKKIYQVQNENVGVEAAHKAEIGTEGGGRLLWHRHKTKPYRTVAKLERKAAKADIKLLYRQAVDKSPQLQSNILSRFMQKQKIKRDYAKAAREAKKAVSRTKAVVQKGTEAAKYLVYAARSNPAVFIIILISFLLVLFIMTAFASCSMLAGGAQSAVVASSYVSDDADIDNAELIYTEWETDLLTEAQNAEYSHPGYDEYDLNIDDMGHSPYELMAYLTARLNKFTFAQAQSELQGIFAEQYQLTFTPETQIRYRTETVTGSYTDPDTGDSVSYSYDVQVPYEYKILHVTLSSRPFTDVILPKMDASEYGHYNVLMITKGNRQYAGSPFDFDWLPYVSCYYGWRINPITGEKENHRGVDIAVPAGTEIHAATDGIVTTAGWDSGYGNYIVITRADGLVTKYAHCETLLVTQGQTVSAGDVIARVGSSGQSTGAHLHFEVMKNGIYLNPLYFSITNNHDSNVIPGSPGGIVIPEYPGEPMDNARFAAMMDVAQRQLGKPYVFGASGPDSFDCSGFVSFVLSHSIYPGFGRTTAQGLFNITTPVSKENMKPGDLIFFQGTYSTPNAVTHVGIYIGNGMMIEAGNPVKYTSITSAYWQKHYYAAGRLP